MSRASAIIARGDKLAERGGEQGTFIRGRYTAGARIPATDWQTEIAKGGNMDSVGREVTSEGGGGLVYPTDER